MGCHVFEYHNKGCSLKGGGVKIMVVFPLDILNKYLCVYFYLF